MIHIQLNDPTRTELQALRRHDLPAPARDRLEMVLLSDADWSVPRIAAHLRYCAATVRAVLHDFRRRGAAALYPRQRGPAPNLARRQHIHDRLTDLLGQPRTWTSRQLSEALAAEGVALSPRQLRRYLRQLRAGYRRTASTVRHKQDPVKVEQAKRVLDNLRQRAAAGQLDLDYLDECGFAPSLPCGYSWTLPGDRKRVPYEYPQGRRVNVLATYRPYAAVPELHYRAFERTLTSDDLIAYLKERPGTERPRVVVLDNASAHVSKVLKAARRELAQEGIYLYYLPAYSPELNAIEALFRQIKYQEIPQRSHTSKTQLRESVEHGFDTYGQKLQGKSERQLRPAA
jgi:putative transposase